MLGLVLLWNFPGYHLAKIRKLEDRFVEGLHWKVWSCSFSGSQTERSPVVFRCRETAITEVRGRIFVRSRLSLSFPSLVEKMRKNILLTIKSTWSRCLRMWPQLWLLTQCEVWLNDLARRRFWKLNFSFPGFGELEDVRLRYHRDSQANYLSDSSVRT